MNIPQLMPSCSRMSLMTTATRLLAADASVDMVDKDGKTALQVAADNSHEAVAQALSNVTDTDDICSCDGSTER